MSDNEATTEEVVGEEPKETGKGLRAQLEAALSENKKLKTTQRDSAFKEAGIDTSGGMGKAISQMYEGNSDAADILKFAKDEYDYDVLPSNPVAAQVAAEQAKLDNVGQTAGSVVAPAEMDVLAKAEAEGDYATAMNIKGQQLADMMRKR